MKKWVLLILSIISLTTNGATLNTNGLPIQSDKDVAKVCLGSYVENLTSNDERINGEVYVYNITYRGDKYAFDMSISGQVKDAHGYPKLVNIGKHTKVCKIKSSQINYYKKIEAEKMALITKSKEKQKAQAKLDNHCISEFQSAFSATTEMNKKVISGSYKDSTIETKKQGNVLDVSVYWNYDGAKLNSKKMNVYVSCSAEGQYISYKLSPKYLAEKEKANLAKEKNAQQQKEQAKLAKELRAQKEQDRLKAVKEKTNQANKVKHFQQKYSQIAKECVLGDASRITESLMRSLPSTHRPEVFLVEKQQPQTMKVLDKYISVEYKFWLYEQKSYIGKLQEKEIVSYSIKEVDGIKVAPYRLSTATAKCLLP